jgi:hypothetical protein
VPSCVATGHLGRDWCDQLPRFSLIEYCSQTTVHIADRFGRKPRRKSACTELKPIYRRLLKMFLEELQLIDQQISQLDQELATLLSRHQDAVEHLAEVPGLSVDSAQQIIVEVGAKAATFPSAKQLSSCVGACPGGNESAGVSKSHRSPKGNRHMQRILNQTANTAATSKGTIFELVYRRLVSRLGHNQTIGAIAHRLCRLIWIILHQGVQAIITRTHGPHLWNEIRAVWRFSPCWVRAVWGEVYRARDTRRLDRTVAVKILPAHLSDNPETQAAL